MKQHPVPSHTRDACVPRYAACPSRRGALLLRTGALLTLTALLGLSGCAREPQSAPPSMVPEVATITVQPERVVLTSELPGRTAALLVAEVRPQVSGLIQKRLFEEGTDVAEGQALYLIDDAPFQAALNQALANVDAARNNAQRARAALEASQAAVVQQQAVVNLARTNRDRFEALAADGAVSLSERDRFVAEADVAEAALQSAQAQVNSARQSIEVAEAGIAQAEAAVASARINLEYTRIVAPISGRIGKSNVTVGSLVTAHQPLALATIQQLDPIYVDVTQAYGEMLRLRQRLEDNALDNNADVVRPVRLILENGQDYPHEGALQFRDVTVDPSTGSVLVRMVFPNPEGILLPGMFVRAILTEGVDPDGILIPQQAVARDFKGRPQVLVVDGDGLVEQRTLLLDRAVGNQWLVAEGLAAGDQVIMEGAQRVRHGSAARAVPYAPPPPEQTAAVAGR